MDTLFSVFDAVNLKGKFIWDHNSALPSNSTHADHCRNVDHGHMAVLCASLYAPEQNFVSPCSLATS